MTETAFTETAQYYDLLYQDKGYEKEAEFIEECIKHYSKTQTILEIGCGTGNYTKIFFEKGYQITGVDISGEMLKIASEKSPARFLKKDVRELAVPERFDCCLALFAVMGYLTENSDVTQALRNIRNHLKTDGLFVFDVWNGLAVMRDLPENRVKEVENDELRIIRFSHPTLRASEHVCDVDFKLVIENKVTKQFGVVNEKHSVRFYFPKEIEHYLKEAGFILQRMCPFMDFNRKVTEKDWNITIIAKAV